MGRALLIGVVILSVTFATISANLQRHAARGPEIVSQQIEQDRSQRFCESSLFHAVEKLREIEQKESWQGHGIFDLIFNWMNSYVTVQYHSLNDNNDRISIRSYLHKKFAERDFTLEARAIVSREITRHPKEQILHLSMDDGTGSTVTDSSRFGYDGQLVNTDLSSSWTSDGVYGGALNLEEDWEGGHVNVGTGPPNAYDDELTIGVWVKVDPSWWGELGLIAAERASTQYPNDRAWRLWTYGRDPIFLPAYVLFGFDITSGWDTDGIYIEKNEHDFSFYSSSLWDWHYIVATYKELPADTAIITIAIADMAQKTDNWLSWSERKIVGTWESRDTTNILCVGGYDYNPDFGPYDLLEYVVGIVVNTLSTLDGQIDEIMVFNRALEMSEQVDLAQYNGIRETKLVSWIE